MNSMDERNEPVEFRVASLVSIIEGRKERNTPFNVLEIFLKEYNQFIQEATYSEIESLYLTVGKNPVKAIHVPRIEQDQIMNYNIMLGSIGFIYKRRYPNVYDEINKDVFPLTLPPTQGLMYLAHFVLFEYNNKTYIIYEMNSNAPSISSFTTYICHAWEKINPRLASSWCPIKYRYVLEDPRVIISKYRYITNLIISGDLRIANAVASFTGINIKDAFIKRKTKRFSLELSGRGEPLSYTIDELIDFLDMIRESAGINSLTRFIVKVKKNLRDKEIYVNLLQNVLSFRREVPRATDEEGRELGSLSTPDAYKALKELVKETIDILSRKREEVRIKLKTRKTLIDFLSR